MNIEQLKKSNWIIYECIVGSIAYGTNKEGSDVDIRGVYIQPTEEILANNYIPQISDDTNDTTFYEIGRFLELASKGNPNIIDLLDSPEHCILYRSELWDKYIPNTKEFLTLELKKTFLGYAYAQIEKAKGLNKKVNWDKSKMVRKTPLDFCYKLINNEKSFLLNDLFERKTTQVLGGLVFQGGIHQSEIGLASVNNFPDFYSMYHMENNDGGIVAEDSNDVQLRSIPKGARHLGYMRFDRNAYSTHCKDYKEYQQWLEKRNPLRYADNAKVDNNYDTKNMMHCIRLLLTAKDIASSKGLIINRPESQYLLDIRNGKLTYEEILDKASILMKEVTLLFNTSNLPNIINKNKINQLLLKIRLENLNQNEIINKRR